MDTETMIRELKRIEEKYKYDKVFTGQVNIAEMAHDVRKRLEELKPYEDTDLTPEQITSLKKRDTAKEPEVFDGNWYKCPVCGKYAGGLKGNFCYNCGQRLNWGKVS